MQVTRVSLFTHLTQHSNSKIPSKSYMNRRSSILQILDEISFRRQLENCRPWAILYSPNGALPRNIASIWDLGRALSHLKPGRKVLHAVNACRLDILKKLSTAGILAIFFFYIVFNFNLRSRIIDSVISHSQYRKRTAFFIHHNIRTVFYTCLR